MAYSPEAHTDFIQYEIHAGNADTNVAVLLSVDTYLVDDSGTIPDEAARDAAFQALVDGVAAIPGWLLINATKRGQHASSVTADS